MTKNELGQGWGGGGTEHSIPGKRNSMYKTPKGKTSQFYGNIGRTDKGPMLSQTGGERESIWPGRGQEWKQVIQ